MPRLSRRSSVATMRSGWLSHMRADTYTFWRSKNTQTSVFSVAGSPSSGSCCTKSLTAGTVA